MRFSVAKPCSSSLVAGMMRTSSSPPGRTTTPGLRTIARTQHAIAHRVAVHVVHLLEVIEVHEEPQEDARQLSLAATARSAA